MIAEKIQAENELKIALTDSSIHNLITSKNLIIKDKETAINVVEPILFSIYGKDEIRKEQPYEVNLINHYWIISGTLSKKFCAQKDTCKQIQAGGTFLIIIDAANSKIIRLTHGK